MDSIRIYGANRFVEHKKFREACRGIVVQNNKILMTYAAKADIWMIPGGGREDGESLGQCCIRELIEETGLIVTPQCVAVTIDEFYGEWLYRSHYYVCEITGKTQCKLTSEESAAGLETRWLPLEEAISIFAEHENLRYSEMKRGAYLREYRALIAFMKEGCA